MRSLLLNIFHLSYLYKLLINILFKKQTFSNHSVKTREAQQIKVLPPSQNDQTLTFGMGPDCSQPLESIMGWAGAPSTGEPKLGPQYLELPTPWFL